MVATMAHSPARILLLAADQFEDMELLYPLYRLAEEGHSVTIAGLDLHPVTGKKGHGPVPWSHEPNRGFLRSLAALATAAGEI